MHYAKLKPEVNFHAIGFHRNVNSAPEYLEKNMEIFKRNYSSIYRQCKYIHICNHHVCLENTPTSIHSNVMVTNTHKQIQ